MTSAAAGYLDVLIMLSYDSRNVCKSACPVLAMHLKPMRLGLDCVWLRLR